MFKLIFQDMAAGFAWCASHVTRLLGIAALVLTLYLSSMPNWRAYINWVNPAAANQSLPATPPQYPLSLNEGATAFLNALSDNALNAQSLPDLVQQIDLISSYLARRYRLSQDAIEVLVSAAHAVGRETDVDPLLILSVMAIESGFNPFAESPMGAQGLMQVMTNVHLDKLDDHGGAHSTWNPVANMRVGAQILKDCIKRGGSLEAGLKLYVGATSGNDRGYGARVLGELGRLNQIVMPLKVASKNRSQSPISKSPMIDLSATEFRIPLPYSTHPATSHLAKQASIKASAVKNFNRFPQNPSNPNTDLVASVLGPTELATSAQHLQQLPIDLISDTLNQRIKNQTPSAMPAVGFGLASNPKKTTRPIVLSKIDETGGVD